MLKRFFAFLLLGAALPAFVFAQDGKLSGKVFDSSTKEALPFATIVLEQNGIQKKGTISDQNGTYSLSAITPGQYDLIVSYVGYAPYRTTGIVIYALKTTFWDVYISSGIEQKPVEIVYELPIVQEDARSTGTFLSKTEIDKIVVKDVNSIIGATSPMVFQRDQGDAVNVKGRRDNANTIYIDNVKVTGNFGIPQSAYEQVSAITGGVPAEYGDVTGGIFSATTRGASDTRTFGVELETSQFLDAYGRNLVGLNSSGPILKKREISGNKKTILGYFLAVELLLEKDRDPSSIGVWKLKDDVLKALEQKPYRLAASGQSMVLNSEFFNFNRAEIVDINGNTQTFENPFENVKPKTKNSALEMRVIGKLDFQPNIRTNIVLGGSYERIKEDQWSLIRSVFNTGGTGELIDRTYRTYIKFKQNFSSGDSAAGFLKNAFYSVQFDYTNFNRTQWDPRFKDNLFEYGYIGKFTSTMRPTFQHVLSADSSDQYVNEYWWPGLTASYWYLTGYTPINTQFTPGGLYPEREQYTSAYYDFWNAGKLLASMAPNGLDAIQFGGGLINGDVPDNVYDLFFGVGQISNFYQKLNRQQYRFTGSFSAQYLNHNITVGVEFEQRVQREFRLRPRQLWGLMRSVELQQAARQMDGSTIYYPYPIGDPSGNPLVNWGFYPSDNPILSNGVPDSYEVFQAWIDSLNGGPVDSAGPGALFHWLIIPENQSYFDKQFRIAKGLSDQAWIQPFGEDPAFYEANGGIKMFSADEYLNYMYGNTNGDTYYYGYNYDGTIAKSDKPFDEFFTDIINRPMGAFRPTYVAGYIQDRFEYKKTVLFNIGVRVDRLDLNQRVLKDKYILYPFYTVKDKDGLNKIGNPPLPDNIEETDAAIYLTELNSTTIKGFRIKDTWYDASGQEVNPELLKTSTGAVAPFLKDPQNQVVTPESFTDYRPRLSVMPRVAFSFHITGEALFFAHYDVLTQRPVERFITLPSHYYLMTSNQTLGINNPNLNPARTIDYELGFQQKLSDYSAITMGAFYSEFKEMIQYAKIENAFPIEYTTFDNIDIGTVKGFSFEYILRRIKNVQMRAGYAIKFAEGTGSSATSSSTGVSQSGLGKITTPFPLDFDQRHAITTSFDLRFKSGKYYNGPVLFKNSKNWNIFQNAGLNLTLRAGSGTPYTRIANVTRMATLSDYKKLTIKGDINSNRVPWQFNADLRIDRDFDLKLGKSDTAKTLTMNVYLAVTNLFDLDNIVSVYRFTGDPDDDGWLASSEAITDIQGKNDTQAYKDLYSIAIQDPDNFSLPRRFRLGVSFNF